MVDFADGNGFRQSVSLLETLFAKRQTLRRTFNGCRFLPAACLSADRAGRRAAQTKDE